MPSITVNVDEALKAQMERHPEINWSEVTRQAIAEKVEALELMDQLTSGSDLTSEDVEEIADQINARARSRFDDTAE